MPGFGFGMLRIFKAKEQRHGIFKARLNTEASADNLGDIPSSCGRQAGDRDGQTST